MAESQVIKGTRFDYCIDTNPMKYGDELSGNLACTKYYNTVSILNLSTGGFYKSGTTYAGAIYPTGTPSLGPCAWANSSKMVFTNDTVSSVEILSISSGFSFPTTITTNTDPSIHTAVNASTSSTPCPKGQPFRPNGIASNPGAGTAGQVAWISNGTGQFAVYDAGSGYLTVCTSPSAGWYYGKQPTAIIAAPGTGGTNYQNCQWYIGFSDGSIGLLASSGEFVKSFSVTDGFAIDSLSASADGSYLYATTFGGNLFTFNVGTSAVLNIMSIGTAQNNWAVASYATLGISAVVNNMFAVWRGQDNSFATVQLFRLVNGVPMCIDRIINNNNNHVIKCGISASANALWVLCDNGRIIVYDLPSAAANSSVDTRTQKSYVDVASRILRLPIFGGAGLALVELDTSVAAGSVSLNASHEEIDYIEASLTGVPFSTENIDARVFEA